MNLSWSRSDVLRELRDLVLFMVASVVQTYFMCPRCNTFYNYSVIWLFNFLLWVSLWKGNSLLANFVTKKIPWIKYPLHRLWVGIVSTIAYTLLAVLGILELISRGFSFNLGSGYKSTIYISMAITILIALILHSREFFLHWRQAARDAERYEKESISAKYESLKGQINPHFLFNTLNVLTNLVYEDQDKAVKFIKQLSQVYRHVLDTRDQELITLKEELIFLDSYLYLQQIRFGDKLKLNIEVKTTGSLIPPLVLQMLVENAIKHNVISNDDPLTISIYESEGCIVVENNLQRKMILPDESPGIGLENIRKRYSILSTKQVEVIENDKFIVKLPLLPA